MAKYPNVEVQLAGMDGNVFAIMGRVDGAMKRQGVSAVERNKYQEAIMNASSYDEALRITMKWVKVK